MHFLVSTDRNFGKLLNFFLLKKYYFSLEQKFVRLVDTGQHEDQGNFFISACCPINKKELVIM